MVIAHSDVPSAGDLSSSIAVFQALITDALTLNASGNVPLLKRNDYSEAIGSVNSIFDTIYGLTDGSIPLPETSLERRTIIHISEVQRLVCLLLGCDGSRLLKREVPADVQEVIDTLVALADGTLPFSLSNASDFTLEDAIEFANLLKDIVVMWRTRVDGGVSSGGIISRRDMSLVTESSIYSPAGPLEKRVSRGTIKMALRVVAAALNGIADAI
jgi:hypothetical protein